MNKQNLLGLSRDEMEALVTALGERPFRGRQLYHQIYQRKLYDFQEMTELSKSFRQRLAESFEVRLPELWKRHEATDGSVKYLFRLEDGRVVESVFIPEEGRDTLCISSQVGCNVGCAFCRTAMMGLQRNLKPHEILGQVLGAIRAGDLQENGFNLVFMGMGEPLLNYKNVMKSFQLMIDPAGMALSHRKITLSTSGVVPVLRKMMEAPVMPGLAVSLNATTDEIRNQLMPLNQKWNLGQLLATCRLFPRESRQRITFEYVLIAGLTDTDADAHRLARLLRGMKAKVNLIPYNPNPGLPYRRPAPERVVAFQRILADHHVSAFLRKTRGDDISAACGQLAYLADSEKSTGEVTVSASSGSRL